MTNNNVYLSRFLSAGVLVFLFATLGPAQQPGSVHPDAGTPELYMSFFFFAEDFAKWTNARVEAADGAHKSSVLKSSAKYVGVAPADFAKLQDVVTQVTSQLRAVSEEAHAYVQSATSGGGPIDHAVLAAFHERRVAIITAGVEQMKATLSPASWQGLDRYINNRHRQHVTISAPGRVVQ